MRKIIAYILLAVMLCTCAVSCSSAKNKTVCGSYSDSATSVITISESKKYSGNINGVSVGGEWKYSNSKITVLDGDDAFDGISLVLLPDGEDERLDAVVYTTKSGDVKLQLNGVVYGKK